MNKFLENLERLVQNDIKLNNTDFLNQIKTEIENCNLPTNKDIIEQNKIFISFFRKMMMKFFDNFNNIYSQRIIICSYLLVQWKTIESKIANGYLTSHS